MRRHFLDKRDLSRLMERFLEKSKSSYHLEKLRLSKPLRLRDLLGKMKNYRIHVTSKSKRLEGQIWS